MEVNAQEKYYLSRFRPLTGMVLSSRIYKRSPVQFSPPYGDGTKAFCFPVCYDRFSPPYGDCTDLHKLVEIIGAFSPPYGDCTINNKKIPAVYKLSPPYGDCTLNISQNTAKLKSRMVRKYSLYCNDVLSH